jgi:hypothetical protein
LLVALKHVGRPNSSISNPLLKGLAYSLNNLEDSSKPNGSSLLVELADEMHLPQEQLASNLLCYTIYSSGWRPVLGADGAPDWPNAICRAIWRCPDQTIPAILDDQPTTPGGILRALATYRPRAIRLWLERCEARAALHQLSAWNWGVILSGSRIADDLCLATLPKVHPQHQLGELLGVLRRERPGEYVAEIDAAIQTPQRAAAPAAMDWLVAYLPSKALALMSEVIAGKLCDPYLKPACSLYREVFRYAAGHLDEGKQLLEEALQSKNGLLIFDCVWAMRDQLTPDNAPILLPLIHTGLAVKLDSGLLAQFWGMSETPIVDLLWTELLAALSTKAKSVRAALIATIMECRPAECVPLATQLLQESKPERRLAAVMLLAMGEPGQTTPLLAAHLATETHDAVREEIHKRLKECGTQIHADAAPSQSKVPVSTKPPKLPKTTWLKESELPVLVGKDGTELPADLALRLIEVQSKHKLLEAAPDILPLLAHLDRARCATFALALVEGFLNSEQAAADRWALALGGLLGDNRLIPPLLSRIPDWCDNARHKLAEYAAQTIALLPGNEPLMVLDTLANRYRNKYKNVGKACAAAFQAAATARGITPAELGDLVVPTFDFDEDGLRTFAWDGGSVGAELGPDFKLTWFDPAGDKTWASLPAAAPAAVKEEVKLLGKLLREAVKAQTARLELALVFQRRWPVARWRELYEAHPLLRAFASGLVWGVYDSPRTLLRTFRRYHNGILADAAGTEEELLEADTQIGMVHPLELDEVALRAWQAHLGRLKVKQPFPQLDRPVELLDPLLANRREIAVTRDKKLSAGTFRSRAEKRGWFRGSVVDAGGISSYVKTYPAVAVEVILPLDNFYIGVDPMDEIELSAAYFVRSETVQRGSYTYDEPGPDDPRVLKFAEIPAVVYSETISDLKAIVATKE